MVTTHVHCDTSIGQDRARTPGRFLCPVYTIRKDRLFINRRIPEGCIRFTDVIFSGDFVAGKTCQALKSIR